MRFHRLRSTFQKLVASAGLLSGGGRLMAPGCCGSIEPAEVNQIIDPREARWSGLVARCRASDLDCTALCKAFVPDAADGQDPAVIGECYIDDRGRGATNVHVSYFFPEECIAGRRPPGLFPAVLRGGGELGAWLAGLAHLEAASVPAFLMLAGDLQRAGAPRALIDAARVAAADEVRHARVMGTLARAAGAELPAVTIAAPRPRALLELALDNAVEGCVRETFAALCATYQAAHAADPVLRAAFADIAVDETGHAALAFGLDAWLMPRLAPAARAQVAAARRTAWDELAAAGDGGMSPALAHAAGWPVGAAAARLHAGSRSLGRA